MRYLLCWAFAASGFQNGDITRLCEADYLLLSRDGYSTFDYDIEAQYPNESKALQKILEGKTFKLYKINKEQQEYLAKNGYSRDVLVKKTSTTGR